MRAQRTEGTKSLAGGTYKKPYVYQKQMQFLQKVISYSPTHDSAIKRTRSQTDSKMEIESSSEMSAQNIPSSSKKSKSSNTDDKISRFLNYGLAPEHENPLLSFFKGILPSLQSFNDDETLEFQSGVLSLIQTIKRNRK